ncbi:MAG TPA: hypothetical protein DEB56_02845 [Thiobacillus sp.]|nr:hypothetical protein [Thiobacillus sp.]
MLFKEVIHARRLYISMGLAAHDAHFGHWRVLGHDPPRPCQGCLTSRHEQTGRRERRVYEVTEQGRVALA